MAGSEHDERRAEADMPSPRGAGEFRANGGSRANGEVPANGGGLSWCWGLDFAALLAAVTGPAPWLRHVDADGSAGPASDDPAASDPASNHPAASDPAAGDPASNHPAASDPASNHPAADDADPETDEEEYRQAVADGRARELPLEIVAGRIAESLPAGPGLAGWLAQARATDLEDGALAGVAASFRRLASWAAAGELAAVAQIASRSARSDRQAEVDPLGRPDRITPDAAGQVALALAMSQDGASCWTDLAVVLTWRLPATGAALATGEIDLPRARMIVRMTTALSDEAARAAEAAVLGRAGWLTLGQLHAALRRAVIKADPEGAERRREEAEQQAKVVLYPEDEGTATLAGYCLPGVDAAAAMARITALAKAMRAAGMTGGMDLARAQVFLGLLLGTLPYIPPSPGAPPDAPPPPDMPPPDEGSRWDDDPSPDTRPDDQDAPPPGKAGPWPCVPPSLAPGPAALAGLRPAAGGLLNLTVPFATLAGASAGPGQLSRLGVVTAGQARRLAALAAWHPATRWRVVVTNQTGQAIAVTHLPRDRASPGGRPGPAGPTVSGDVGLARRVTLIITNDALDSRAPSGPDPSGPDSSGPDSSGPADSSQPGSPLATILSRARDAAIRVTEQAANRAVEDTRAGGCAHELASMAYRPPPRIAELVTARDGTCRFGPCRRPAEQCDLDHTIPFDQGGLTCSCNLGGQCRSHHRLKQRPGWTLTQPTPGVFLWTTPAGRGYTVRPDPLE